MTIATVTVCDATRDNIASLPKGMTAGYTTGSGGIAWTAADWKAHPGAVRIDQDAAASDPTADVLDVERGAASPSDCPGWVKRALADYAGARRPGQRKPAIYMSLSEVTPVVNALIAGGIHSGAGLWVAHWGITTAQATALVTTAGGPFPIIGVQYRNAGAYDVSVFSRAWLDAVSGTPPPAGPYRHTAPGGRSLAQLAAARNTTPAHLTQVTAAAMTPADVTVNAGLPLPAGWVFYTTNP